MTQWDIVTEFYPEEPITELKTTAKRMSGSLSTSVKIAIVIGASLLPGASGNFQLITSLSAMTAATKSHLSDFVGGGDPTTRRAASSSVHMTDTQFGQSSIALGRRGASFFRDAEPEADVDVEYNFG